MSEIAVCVNTFNKKASEAKWVDLKKYNTYDAFIARCFDIHSDEEYPNFILLDYKGFPKGFFTDAKTYFWDSKKGLSIFDYLQLDDKSKEILDLFVDRFSCNYIKAFQEYQEGYMGQYDCFEDFAKERVHKCIFLVFYMSIGDVTEDINYSSQVIRQVVEESGLDVDAIAKSIVCDLKKEYTFINGHVFKKEVKQ